MDYRGRTYEERRAVLLRHGGDIVEDSARSRYLKARIVRAHFGDEYE